MHDDLLAVAARRGRVWCVVAAAVLGAGPAIVVAVLAGSVAGGATGGLFAGMFAAWLLGGAPGAVRPPWPSDETRPAELVVQNVAEGIAIANGELAPAVLQVVSAAPNVAAFEVVEGDVLVVTDGAVASLTRDQLEAVCAAQLAIAHDATCRRLEGAAAALLLLRVVGIVAFTPVVVLTSTVPAAGWPFMVVVGFAEVAGWLVGGRLRWWARIAGDGVAVRTTRHPEPLATGLRVLARWNGPQVRIRWAALLAGTGTTRWAVPVGVPFTSETRINGRLVDRRSRELVEDAKLLVRAGLVRRVCLQGERASLSAWKHAAAAVRSAGRAAATGGAATIEGEQVGLDGTR